MASMMGNSAMEAYLRQATAPQSNVSTSESGGQKLSTALRERFESKSGVSLDDVRVHYNSDKPARLGALAYAQGIEVHIGPGQEEHLEHELGHVVQQKQGRVRPTTKIGGVTVNDDPTLENETDTVLHSKMPYISENNYSIVQLCGFDIKRKGFPKAVKESKPVSPGSGDHRRHIVSFELIKECCMRVYYSTLDKGALLNGISKFLGVDYSCAELAVQALADILGREPKNLIVDSGAENSALGGIGYAIARYLQKSPEQIYSDIIALVKLNGVRPVLLSELMEYVYSTDKVLTKEYEMLQTIKMAYADKAVPIEVLGDALDPKRETYRYVEQMLLDLYYNTQTDVMTKEVSMSPAEKYLITRAFKYNFAGRFRLIADYTSLLELAAEFLNAP
jgi:hypothetical protein